jgi:hypothetical protein
VKNDTEILIAIAFYLLIGLGYYEHFNNILPVYEDGTSFHLFVVHLISSINVFIVFSI